MRIRTAVLMTGLVLLVFYGCAYVNIRTPYDTDLDRTQIGSKTGTAEASVIEQKQTWFMGIEADEWYRKGRA